MAMERILILDDEPDVTKSWVRILGSAGYQCLATTDPQEAMRLLESEHPDLLANRPPNAGDGRNGDARAGARRSIRKCR